MRNLRRRYYWIIGLLLWLGCLVAFFLIGQLYAPLHVPAQGMVYELKSGYSLTQVAKDLKALQVLNYPRLWIGYARLRGQSTQLKPGEYFLTQTVTPVRLLQNFSQGNIIHYGFTIPEGWTFRQILTALDNAAHLQHRLTNLSEIEVMQRLGQAGASPEGRCFPDTYHFYANMSDVELLQQCFQKMERILAREWQQRAAGLPYKTPYEALIMASIIEKETGVTVERDRIAGVFINRLQQSMRLQSDPTVIYGLAEHYHGNLTQAHLQGATPFNTYKIAGLPPTPIASPGLAAIKAALHPMLTGDLYFVSKGNGEHQFSTNLSEHNQAVTKFQRK